MLPLTGLPEDRHGWEKERPDPAIFLLIRRDRVSTICDIPTKKIKEPDEARAIHTDQKHRVKERERIRKLKRKRQAETSWTHNTMQIQDLTGAAPIQQNTITAPMLTTSSAGLRPAPPLKATNSVGLGSAGLSAASTGTITHNNRGYPAYCICVEN